MLLVVLAGAALLVGCSGGDDSQAIALLDGSAPAELAVELEGIEGEVVITGYDVVETATLDSGSKAGSCLRERFPELIPGSTGVVRTGVRTETVTFVERGDQAVFACSNAPGPREKGRWCGGAYGQLSSGRLRDPRLSIACMSRDGARVGFVWLEPGEGARYVAVAQPGYTEVYEVAGGLPIRIATVSGVDVETSSATFEISEHDAQGRRLRAHTLEAFVAG